MTDAKGSSSSSFRNPAPGAGKHPFLPPKSPFPAAVPVPQSYADYVPHAIGPKGVPKPREGQRQHQRTTSESFLVEEQPSWLDDLLNEPETPVRRGAHRRASSDSITYLDVANLSLDYPVQEGQRHRHGSIASLSSWGSGEFDYLNEVQQSSYYAEQDLFGRAQNRGWAAGVNVGNYQNNVQMQTKEKVLHQRSSGVVKESGPVVSPGTEKQEREEPSQEQKGSAEKKDDPHGKNPLSEMDNKRAKQQFAQRSRVRKLQYIAELERNVQALQAEGLVFTAELEFLNQQNLMLDLENKALKQRLDSLEQEHVIKCLQHEMLEREIARLRAMLFQQQQQQQQQQVPTPSHVRRNSRDLDSQLANLSLKHKDANSGRDSGRDSVTGPLRI